MIPERFLASPTEDTWHLWHILTPEERKEIARVWLSIDALSAAEAGDSDETIEAIYQVARAFW